MTPAPQRGRVPAWKVSLHGGHSGEFCEHAEGALRETLEAAGEAGYLVFGLSEHAPRSREEFLYDSEREKGFDVERLRADFANYAATARELAEEFSDRLTVLRGFETEVVPAASYREEMIELRRRYGFDYIVGSVHHVNEIPIDFDRASFEKAAESCGGIEPLAVRYYEIAAEMIDGLKPEVAGHLDLIRKLAPPGARLDTPPIRRAAQRALEAAAACGAILDVNTAALRNGLGAPYPAPWLIKAALRMGVSFCFGDDSHAPDQVGSGVEAARDYLLRNGVSRIEAILLEGGRPVRKFLDLKDF